MLSIVILTFDSKEYIKPCLDSLFDQNYLDFEAIVVDNGSKDGTVDFVKRNYPRVILIENRENLGACKGRNQGIEASNREWILTLDCDVVLERDFLFKALRTINNLPSQVGMLQPKVLNPDKETIYSCGISLSWLRRFSDIGKGRKDIGRFNKSKYIFGACAACAVYNRQMLEELKEETGYFDERFFFLVEDVDLSWRAQKRGWKALFCPETVCYHMGSSSNFNRQLRQYLCFRNRYFMIKKNESLIGKLKLFFLSFWYEVFRFLYLVLTNKYLLNPPQTIINEN